MKAGIILILRSVELALKGVNFSGLSRQQKRHMPVTVINRVMKMTEALDLITQHLPPCMDRNGDRINHYSQLKYLYMKGGLKAINEYIDLVEGTLNIRIREIINEQAEIAEKNAGA